MAERRENKISCEVVETLAEFGGGKMLRVVKWNGKEEMLDFRRWFEDDDGNEKPGKGISFSKKDASDIIAALEGYLDGESGE